MIKKLSQEELKKQAIDWYFDLLDDKEKIIEMYAKEHLDKIQPIAEKNMNAEEILTSNFIDINNFKEQNPLVYSCILKAMKEYANQFTALELSDEDKIYDWEHEFMKVVNYWYNSDAPNMNKLEFINVVKRRVKSKGSPQNFSSEDMLKSFKSGYEKRVCDQLDAVLKGEGQSSSYNSEELDAKANRYMEKLSASNKE